MSGGGWDLEEIRRRADIVEIISPHVRLRKAGRRLVGLCPFHQERTPSFTVDPEAGLWHCFGCKAGGDLFRFVEMMEKVSFAEAVELLARRLGLPPRRPADAARQRARERLIALHEQAAVFFQSNLSGKGGGRARAYLRGRGISPQSVEEFGLGYAPDAWEALLNAMVKRGFSAEELARGGLVIPKEGGFYDRFRERVIFPIRDAVGRVVAFGGRTLADDQQPKYLNSPETPLFQKGHTLWAFDRARRAMGEAERAIVVEGYLDAIACHEVGLAETVATMGTALTAHHVDLLRRRVERLVLAFDSDSAGLAAALRGRELFQEAGLEVGVATMPEGSDPDSVIHDRGAAAFQELLAAAVPMVEWELSRILAQAEGKGERARMEALRAAVSALARLPAGADREYYVQWLAERSGSDSPHRRRPLEAELRQALALEIRRRGAGAGRTRESSPGPGSVREQSVEKAAGEWRYRSLLAAFLQHAELAPRYVGMVEAEDFPSREPRGIFEAIRRLVEREEPVSPETVLAEVEPELSGLLAELSVHYVPEKRTEDLEKSLDRLLEDRLQRRRRALLEQLEEATSEGEREAVRKELTEIARRRSELAGKRIVGEA